MNRRIVALFIGAVALVVMTAIGVEPQTADPVKLTPRPRMVIWEQGKFQLTKFTKIMYSGDGAKAESESLAAKLRPATGYPFPVAGPPPAGTFISGIFLELGDPKATPMGPDGFGMAVGHGNVRVSATTTNGLAKGCTILLQLLPAAILEKTPQVNVKWEMLRCTVMDIPDGPEK